MRRIQASRVWENGTKRRIQASRVWRMWHTEAHTGLSGMGECAQCGAYMPLGYGRMSNVAHTGLLGMGECAQRGAYGLLGMVGMCTMWRIRASWVLGRCTMWRIHASQVWWDVHNVAHTGLPGMVGGREVGICYPTIPPGYLGCTNSLSSLSHPGYTISISMPEEATSSLRSDVHGHSTEPWAHV